MQRFCIDEDKNNFYTSAYIVKTREKWCFQQIWLRKCLGIFFLNRFFHFFRKLTFSKYKQTAKKIVTKTEYVLALKSSRFDK